MKNNLNEQISRIKGMMGMISEQSFEPTSSGQKYDMPSDNADDQPLSNNKPTNPRIFFNNGGSISIQASRTAYCEPRNDEGPYSEMELGFPTQGTEIPDSLLRYEETSQEGMGEDFNPYESVYGYVPVAVIKELINVNGGIKSGQLPPMAEENYESSVENDDYDEKQERNYGVEDLNELGGYIGNAPEKITGPKIAKVDPRIHEGYSGYDVLRAHRLLLNIYSYGDIEMPTEDYLKLSNYMQEIYKSVKYDEDWKNTHGESPDGEPNKEDMPF
jgi:hypothetical protein